jgi:hypothetical protein
MSGSYYRGSQMFFQDLLLDCGVVVDGGLAPPVGLSFTHKWGYWTQGVWIEGRGSPFQNEETKRDWE